MHITILGKRWELKLVDGRTMPNAFGACEPPDSLRKEIRIRKNLDDKRMLDTVIHECLHAADWHRSEEFVERVATDIAEALTRLGYRRKGHDE